MLFCLLPDWLQIMINSNSANTSVGPVFLVFPLPPLHLPPPAPHNPTFYHSVPPPLLLSLTQPQSSMCKLFLSLELPRCRGIIDATHRDLSSLYPSCRYRPICSFSFSRWLFVFFSCFFFVLFPLQLIAPAAEVCLAFILHPFLRLGVFYLSFALAGRPAGRSCLPPLHPSTQLLLMSDVRQGVFADSHRKSGRKHMNDYCSILERRSTAGERMGGEGKRGAAGRGGGGGGEARALKG